MKLVDLTSVPTEMLEILSNNLTMAVFVGPCHNGMARPQVAMEERPPRCRVAANRLNKQSRTVDKGWSSS